MPQNSIKKKLEILQIYLKKNLACTVTYESKCTGIAGFK